MVSCEHCGKIYSSQYALDRHRQNHSGRSQHTCSICHVTYFRRDLLARHQKIHKRSMLDEAAEVSAATLTSPPPTRRRRHTACLRCADQKKKCNGDDPCANCNRAGRKCVFSAPRGRISRDLAGKESRAADDSQNNASSVAMVAIQHISKTAGAARHSSDIPNCTVVNEAERIQDHQLLNYLRMIHSACIRVVKLPTPSLPTYMISTRGYGCMRTSTCSLTISL